jgi:hypothetical protein
MGSLQLDDFDVVYQTSDEGMVKGKATDIVPAYKDPRNVRKVKEAIAAHPITVRRYPCLRI